MSSCNSWFEVEPKGDSSGAKTFSNESAFRDYMNGIYTELRSTNLYGSNLTLGGLEFLSQTFVPYEEAKAWTLCDFSGSFARTLSHEVYTKMYRAIYQCNDILELFAEKSDVLFVDGSREMMMAEARALRAFLHFELLRLYAPAYGVDSSAEVLKWVESTSKEGARMSTAQMTEKIISELTAAIGELGKYDPVVTGVGYDDNVLLGTSPIDRKWKLNYYAAQAVLARALMTCGTTEAYGKAYVALDTIIQSGKYPFVRTIDDRDYSFSAEYIFGLPSDNDGFCQVSEDLFNPARKGVTLALDVNGLSADDRRRYWFDDDNTMRTKFDSTSVLDNWEIAPSIPVVKIGEVYLMAAESAAKSGNLAQGVALFNDFIGTQRNSADRQLPATATAAELEAAIGEQYRYEFMGEGVRFLYCKRLNQTMTAYDGTTSIPSVGSKCLPLE